MCQHMGKRGFLSFPIDISVSYPIGEVPIELLDKFMAFLFVLYRIVLVVIMIIGYKHYIMRAIT